MKIKLIKEKSCFLCKSKEQLFDYSECDKKIYICKDCLEKLYLFAQKQILPKSPKSIISKDSRIKIERF